LLKIEKAEAILEKADIVECSIPAVLVDRTQKKGRIRTPNGQSLRADPEEKFTHKRALIIRENAEELVVLGYLSVRFIRSAT
jgi:bifunctional ADP-heptose synthase (sugar kinase/adenylyltransferase)